MKRGGKGGERKNKKHTAHVRTDPKRRNYNGTKEGLRKGLKKFVGGGGRGHFDHLFHCG